eukprot:RCo045178
MGISQFCATLLLLFCSLAVAKYRVNTYFADPDCNPARTIALIADIIADTIPCPPSRCAAIATGTHRGYAATVTCLSGNSTPDISGYFLSLLSYTNPRGNPVNCSAAGGDVVSRVVAYRPVEACQYYPPYTIPEAATTEVFLNMTCVHSSVSSYTLYTYDVPQCSLEGHPISGMAGCWVERSDITKATQVVVGAKCPTSGQPRMGPPAGLLVLLVVVLTSQLLVGQQS